MGSFRIICSRGFFNIKATYKAHFVVASKVKTMKLDKAKMDLVINPTVLKLNNMFSQYGHEIRIAGGAVRDLLLGEVPDDLDFATTATPEEMQHMFEKEEIRMINAGGVKHGTVTARIDDQNFECTTLRIDVTTDGRHAEVEFTKDWALDANRRDLTVNAMFLGIDGTVYDYFDGRKHLEERRILFVGDSDIRIQEDYLRILRYFRFYGRLVEGPDSHDCSVIKSITTNASGLQRISGERIWVELKKILQCDTAGDLIVKMGECGLNDYIGLCHLRTKDVQQLCDKLLTHKISNSSLQPMTLLAAGFETEDDAFVLVQRIKCSNRERDLLFFILKHRNVCVSDFKVVKDIIAEDIFEKKNKNFIKSCVHELLLYTCNFDMIEIIKAWDMPAFPVSGHMLIGKVSHKREIRVALRELFKIWKESDYTLSADELLDRVNVVSS